MLKSFFILLFLAIFLDANPLILTSNMQNISTNSALSFLEDTTKESSIADIKTQIFQKGVPFQSNQGESKSNWWLKFEVYNPTDKGIDWVLKFNYGQFDELQCWQYDANDTLISHTLKGDHYINESRTSLNERSSFELKTLPKQTNTVYVKIAYTTSGVMELFHSVWSKQAFLKSQALRLNFLVGILSALLVLLFYNIFIWFILRKNEYFWYNIYLIGVILSTLTFNQLGAHYLWHNSLYLIDMMPFIAVVTLFVSFVLFTREFLETFKRLPRIDKLLKVLIIFNLPSIVLANIGMRHSAIVILHIISFSFIFFPVIGFILWHRGYKIARGYTVASSILSVTILLSLLRFSELLQTNELLYWIGRFGFIAEGILLSIALADRITILETAKIDAQEEVKDTLEQAKKNLESEVKKRTKELEIQTQKAHLLARTDEMTGIYNRRAFLEHGEEMIYNAQRYNETFSLIIMDIDHFKKVNDTYGHEAGDLVLQTFAKEINNHIRDSDFFARIGGEEFVLLLPHTDANSALQKAQILLASIQHQKILYKNSHLSITASMGICQYKEKEQTIYTILTKADKALYHVKENGRNNVHICSSC